MKPTEHMQINTTHANWVTHIVTRAHSTMPRSSSMTITKKDENESVVAQSQKVTFIQNQNEKFHHYRAQESSQFLSSLLLNTILLLLKKSPGLEEPRVKLK